MTDPNIGTLKGQRVVLTRARAQADGLAEQLRSEGAEILYLPTIEITAPTSWGPLDHAIRKLAEGLYDWTVFASVNAVEGFFARVEVAERDARVLARCRVAAVGPATATRLAAFGIRADLMPSEYTGDALAGELGSGGGHILLPRVEDGPRALIDELVARGWLSEVVAAYRSVAGDPEGAVARLVRSGAFTVLTFTSGSTVRRFVEQVSRPEDLGLDPGTANGKLVACIGPRTAEAAEQLGFRVDLVPAEHSAEGLAAALSAHVATSDSDL